LLEGKNVLVTGGSRGIGRTVTIGFAKAGANVGLVYHQNSEAAFETLKTIEEMGKNGVIIQGDVSQRSEAKKIGDTMIETFDHLDILVNNAGIQTKSRFWELTEDEWDAVINVNLKGAFLISQYASKLMMQQKWGRIINISSICGEIVDLVPEHAHYSASKGGLNMLTKEMAVELAPYGITVNAVAPGAIMTDMTAEVENEEGGYIDKVIAKTPIGRIGYPKDIFGIVKFLCSEEAEWITGQIITVDGGYILQRG